MAWHRLLSIAVFSLSLTACAETAPVAYFYPFSSVAPRAPQVTKSAVPIYAAETDTLSRAGGVLLGTVRVDGESDVPIKERARVAAFSAARAGGTHMVLRQSAEYGSRPVVMYGPRAALEPPKASGFRYEIYSVIRVPVERWAELPPPLLPPPITAMTR
jgi:hypothetical protein